MWQQIGQLQGGTIGGLALAAGADGRPAVLAITPAGGFASRGGDAWRPLSPDPGPALNDVIAVSPTFGQDGTIFVAGRTGVFRSTDGGQSWQHVLAGEVLSVAVSPAYAEDQTLFVGTAQDGVLTSSDGGSTWGGANTGLLDLTVLAVACSPRFGQDRTAFVGTASALYRTRNGGRSWREVPLGALGREGVAVQVLAVSANFATDKLVLAGTEAHGLLRSTDGGGRFAVVPELAERGISALTLADDGKTVVVAAGSELLCSDDSGLTWEALPEAPGLVLALALHAVGTTRTLVAGLHRLGTAQLALNDGSPGWTLSNDGLHASLLTALVPSPAFPTDHTLYGLSLDEGVLASRDGGLTWVRAWPEDADPAVAALAAAHGDTSPVLLAATTEQLYRSIDGGQRWDALPPESAPPLHLLTALPPGGPNPAFLGIGARQANGRQQAGLAISEDGGLTWRPAGHLGAGEAGWSFTVDGLAVSPAFWADRTLVARGVETRADGDSRTRLWRSTDAGRTWSIWYEESGSDGQALPATLLMPPASPSGNMVVQALGGRVLTPVAGSWERHGGQRRPVWHSATLGPEVGAVTALAAPPAAKAGSAAERAVFAATNAGPYLSRDGGRTFRPWRDGYTGGGLVALAVSPLFATDRTVFAVGVGGAIWRATAQ
jgi:photosystem II stability/assembly factor-like uncharacterized protein